MLLLGVGAAGCGDGMGDVTLTIGARSNPLTTSARSNDAEDAILSQIFAQALEDAGYAVKRNPKPLDAGRAAEAVEQGRISGLSGPPGRPAGVALGPSRSRRTIGRPDGI
jgi:hypothetical protein